MQSLSLQAYINTTVEEFIHLSKNSTNTVVILLDTRYSASKKFIEKGLLQRSTELIEKNYPNLSIRVVDRRNPGKAKGDVLYEKFVIYEYPSANLIMSSVRIPIPGSMKPEKLLERVERRLGNYPLEISTLHGIGKLDPARLIIFYHSADQKFDYLMKGFSCRFIKPQFVQLQSADIVTRLAQSYGFTLHPWNTTVLIAKYPLSNTLRQMASPTSSSLLPLVQFISIASKPPANYFTEGSVNDIHEFRRGVVIYVCEPNRHQNEIDIVTRVVEDKYKIVKSVLIEDNNPSGKEFLRSIGFPVTTPGLYLIRKRYDGRFNRYIAKKNSGFTFKYIESFIEDAMDDLLPKHYMSQEVPSDDNNLYPGVKTLVGSTLSTEVFQKDYDYHIVFMFDRLTSGALPAFQQLSAKYKHDNLKYYILDMDNNDHPRLRASHEGKILLYSKTEGLLKTFPVDVASLRLDKFSSFLSSHIRKDKSILTLINTVDQLQDL